MVEHVNIADADRHEPRGASTAGLNQVLHADGDGTTTWKFVDWDDVANKPGTGGYETVLSAFSSSNQNPVALDTPIQVNFGSPQSNTYVSLGSNGTLTFNESGNYVVTLFLRFGRTAGVGNSILLTRFLINDVQGLNSNAASLPDANSVTPFSATLTLGQMDAGDTFKLQLMRDSSGINNGGLTSIVPALAGWNVAPSATIVVARFVGDS